MTTDIDLRERPVVFVVGELEPVPVPRGRQQLIGRLALFVLAGITALGALAAVASWSVTGSVGSTDPPRSLWYLPPAATEPAINLSDNHPAPVTIPATASAELSVVPSPGPSQPSASAEDNPKLGGEDGDASGHRSESRGSGADDGSPENGSPDNGNLDDGGGKSGGGSGSSGSGDDNPAQDSAGGEVGAQSGSSGGSDDSPSSTEAARSESSTVAQDFDDPTADSGNSGGGGSGGDRPSRGDEGGSGSKAD